MERRGAIRPLDGDSLELAVRLVRGGDLIVMPTDTVYGIACDPTNPRAVGALFAAKRRPAAKSLQVLLSSLEGLGDWGLELPAPLDVLARKFCPGGFSPICIAHAHCPFATVRVEDAPSYGRTQAVRVPASEAALHVLEATGPLAASSANLSGGPSSASVAEAVAALGDSVALYLDGGPTPGPVPSTVVAACPGASDGIDVLRAGVIGEADIRAALR